MSETDVKPSAQDEASIEVDSVTEILEDGIEVPAGPGCDEAAEVADRTGAAVAGDAASSKTTRITSKSEVIRILSEFGKPFVAQPVKERGYVKKRDFRTVMKAYSVNKLRPLRPTKSCRRYLLFRLPYRSSVISFHEPKLKYLPQKPAKADRRSEAQPDTDALPISFDDYVAQMDSSCKLFVASERWLEPSSGSISDLDVHDVKKYKSQLLSRINYKFIDVIMATKASAQDFQGIIYYIAKDQFALDIDTESWEQPFPFKAGLKIRITLAGEELFGDVVSVLRYEGKLRMTVKLKEQKEEWVDWKEMTCTVRAVGLIGHLMLQAKAILTLELFHLHAEFLDPILKSLSSAIDISFSENFFKTYGKDPFYTDSVQKIVDTVALNQSDVSSICVVDHVDSDKLTDLFIDSVRYLLKKEKDIVENLREVTEVCDAVDDNQKSLNMIIVSDSEPVLEKMMRELTSLRFYDVKEKPPTAEVIEFLKEKLDSAGTSKDGPISSALDAITNEPYRSEKYESAKKSACQIFLDSCPIIIGTVCDLLNDEYINCMLRKQSRKFDVVIVHNASAFSDSELISLLLFEVRKLVCFSVTARDDQNNTIAHRMVKKAAQRDDFDSQSPVLDRSVYLQREEKLLKEKIERGRAAYSHAHSFKNNDPARSYGDNATRECHQQQAQRSNFRPQLPFRPGAGQVSHPPRGRGRGPMAYGPMAMGRGYEPRGRGHQSYRGNYSQRY